MAASLLLSLLFISSVMCSPPSPSAAAADPGDQTALGRVRHLSDVILELVIPKLEALVQARVCDATTELSSQLAVVSSLLETLSEAVPKRVLEPYVFARRVLGKPCRGDKDCSSLRSDTMCSNAGRCECREGFQEVAGGFCRPHPQLSEPCRRDSDCEDATERAVCENSVCACPSNHLNVNNTECRPYPGLSERCLTDGECQVKSEPAVCEDGVCTCPPSFWNLNNTECRPAAVAVRASINMTETIFAPGVDIRIPCETSGYPIPKVTWYKDGIPLQTDDRRRVEGDELLVLRSEPTDTGSYRCEVDNVFSTAESTVSLTVEGVYVHPNCTDNPFFSNCKLIVSARYCANQYYVRFCCRSCTLDGQLPPTGRHLNYSPADGRVRR